MSRVHSLLALVPTRLYLTLGLASLAASVLMVAGWLHLVPDAEAAVRSHRAALAESTAVAASLVLDEQDPTVLADVLDLLHQRQPKLVSVGVRRADGTLLVDVADHASRWPLQAGQLSSDSRIIVPVLQGGMTWGAVEMQFEPLRPEGWRAALADPILHLTLFMFAASALAFYFYLGRMLQHLDPSRAVPSRVRHALDSLTEGLLVLDARARILLANQSLANVLGVTPEALMGKAAADIQWTARDGARLPLAQMPWQAALQERQVQRDVLVYLAGPEGRRSSLRSNCSPILGPNGDLHGVLVSLQDITVLEEKEVALQAAKDEADHANRAKSQFLANMSHEIRTPMNAILGFTEVLRRGGLRGSQDAPRHLEIIHSSGRHLLNLINDILDLSKVEAGRIEVERIAYAPHKVAHDVVQTLAERATDKQIALRVHVPQALPASLMGDPARLRQILTNLVGNAIKFTERGGVELTLRLDESSPPRWYRIDVTDSGIGIPADRLESVFEPFVQAEASTARRFGGTGLGLTISRGLARAMGGDVDVRSVLGQGTTFTVSLPLDGADLTQLLTPDALQAAGTVAERVQVARWHFPRKLRVLVVDDAPENRELVRVVLEEAGMQVDEADDGTTAIEMVQRVAPDIVLMDMQMPVMDGATATRTLRDRGCTLPIIALTANAMKGVEHEIEAAGFSGYQPKPILVDELIEDIARRLGGVREEEADMKSDPTPQAEDAVDEAPLTSRLATHPRLHKISIRFVEQWPAKLAEMRTAHAAGDLTALGQLAHWLKGAGSSVGYDALFEPAKALEDAAKAGDAAVAAQELDRLERLGRRLRAPAALDGGATPAAT
jgi:PAS domain S-box-containing protein